MKALLERDDINPNAADRHGQTPLSIAAQNGRKRVVELLLKRADIDTDMKDITGGTAFSLARSRGHHAIVELLSKHKNFIPSLDGDGLTALSLPEPSDPDQRPFKKPRRF